jgi:glyoxylase-like metal-dependent hydrolase (beta-lactamase superfamily II)
VLVGDVEIEPIVDAVGELGELGELYPETPAGDWAPYRDTYPGLFAETRWRLLFTSYLLRTSETTVLVDTGIGPPGTWGIPLETKAELPKRLEELGVGRDEIDVVFLTHLHIDHLGWNADGDGAVYFPRARYVVHRDALAFARTRPELPHIRRCVEGLLDRFHKLTGDMELVPDVTAIASPGHYPGHMSLRLASGGREAVLLADVAVHPALLHEPDWQYVSDLDPSTAADTRRALVPELVDRDVLVACGHYPGSGIGRVLTRDGRIVWAEVK